VENLKTNMYLKNIRKISPLYDYWKSEQNDQDEQERILKSNKNSKAVHLFLKEPYKWENLFQSIIREVIKGDKDSIKGLKVILDCLNMEEKEKVILGLEKEEIFNTLILKELRKPIEYNSITKKNLLRFFRILFSIFTNPYQLELKGSRKHLYEKTGYLINNLRKLIS